MASRHDQLPNHGTVVLRTRFQGPINPHEYETVGQIHGGEWLIKPINHAINEVCRGNVTNLVR